MDFRFSCFTENNFIKGMELFIINKINDFYWNVIIHNYLFLLYHLYAFIHTHCA